MNNRKPPTDGNNGTRVAVNILLRTAMRKTLSEMFEQSKGEGGTWGTFETFLTEILENAAADFRLKQWQSHHPNEREMVNT